MEASLLNLGIRFGHQRERIEQDYPSTTYYKCRGPRPSKQAKIWSIHRLDDGQQREK